MEEKIAHLWELIRRKRFVTHVSVQVGYLTICCWLPNRQIDYFSLVCFCTCSVIDASMHQNMLKYDEIRVKRIRTWPIMCIEGTV